MQKQLEQTMRELRIRNYSRMTIESYVYDLKRYFVFKMSDLERVDNENIKSPF